jgi:hypothetical protein
MCEAFGLKGESAPETGHVTKNADGTYSLRLTEAELKNLTIRLALSVLADRRS